MESISVNNQYSSGTTVDWVYSLDGVSHTPNLTLSFFYEYGRDGANMKYRIKTSLSPCKPNSYGRRFGYEIDQTISLDGNAVESGHVLKPASTANWNDNIEYTTDWFTIHKESGTTSLAIRVWSDAGQHRDMTFTAQLYVVPYNPHSKINRTNDSGSNWSKTYKVYKTTNGGTTWEQVDVYKSTDSGSNWVKVD